MSNIGEPVREHEIELEPAVAPRESEPVEQPVETPEPQKEKETVPG